MALLQPYNADNNPTMNVPHVAPKAARDPTHEAWSLVKGPVLSGGFFERRSIKAGDNQPRTQPWLKMIKFAEHKWLCFHFRILNARLKRTYQCCINLLFHIWKCGITFHCICHFLLQTNSERLTIYLIFVSEIVWNEFLSLIMFVSMIRYFHKTKNSIISW